jgi:hypothetical protein
VRLTLTAYRIPLAYYLDKHSIFRFVLHQEIHVRYKLRENEGGIQFRKALSSLGIGMIYTGKWQAQAKGKVEKAFDYSQRRLPYLFEKHKGREISEARKILDDPVSYYNEQRIHEETGEIPLNRSEQAIPKGKGKLRPLEPSVDLKRVFSIHLQRKVRRDGTIMFMAKKWSVGYPEGTSITLYLIPNVKFIVYDDDKKLWELHL